VGAIAGKSPVRSRDSQALPSRARPKNGFEEGGVDFLAVGARGRRRHGNHLFVSKRELKIQQKKDEEK